MLYAVREAALPQYRGIIPRTALLYTGTRYSILPHTCVTFSRYDTHLTAVSKDACLPACGHDALPGETAFTLDMFCNHIDAMPSLLFRVLTAFEQQYKLLKRYMVRSSDQYVVVLAAVLYWNIIHTRYVVHMHSQINLRCDTTVIERVLPSTRTSIRCVIQTSQSFQAPGSTLHVTAAVVVTQILSMPCSIGRTAEPNYSISDLNCPLSRTQDLSIRHASFQHPVIRRRALQAGKRAAIGVYIDRQSLKPEVRSYIQKGVTAVHILSTQRFPFLFLAVIAFHVPGIYTVHIITFTFQRNSWSWVSSLLPPGTYLDFYPAQG